jgi:5'-nucleotidase
MSPFLRPALSAFAIMLVSAASHAQAPAPVDLRILAINDFHGYLRPPPGGITITDPEESA